MNKQLLIKHIKGETSLKESQQVIDWINKSSVNEDYYISLTHLVIDYGAVTGEYFTSKNPLSPTNKKTFFNNKTFNKILITCAAACLVISVGLNIWQFNKKNYNNYVSKTIQENGLLTYYTEKGVKGIVILPDKSKVWLNSGSTITYPQQFASDIRRIEFEGEGYFEIESNSKWPMEVKTTKGMKLEVLGTKFHIKSYSNDVEEEATLFSGKVNITKSNKGKVLIRHKTLKPLEALKFNTKGEGKLIHNADTVKNVAWKRGELVFEQTPMPEVIKMLERWHGVNFIIKDNAVMNYNYTANFTQESIVQIMELFKFTSPLDYEIKDDSIILKTRKI